MGSKHGSLIEAADVGTVFSDIVIKRLAHTAKLPAGVDLVRFAQSIRIAAGIFMAAKAQRNAPALAAAIEHLYSMNTQAESGAPGPAKQLARAIAAMPEAVRRWLMS